MTRTQAQARSWLLNVEYLLAEVGMALLLQESVGHPTGAFQWLCIAVFSVTISFEM